MDIQLLKLEEKLEKSNASIRELYDILFFEDDEFEKVFGIQLSDKKGVTIHDEFIIECFCVGFGIDGQSDLKETLKRGGYSEIEITSILKKFEDNFVPAFKELTKLGNITTNRENTLEEPKLAEKTDSTHISHHDILSEIENPTPSLDTTTDFQNASNIVSPTNISNTTNIASTTQPTTSANPIKSNISTTSTEPSLHSPTPTAPYTNPALHIATKLGQNLSTPSASIPKDIYISKKPDPYHEPVQ